ncbi:MAG: Nif11-like leader peptide family natural product precursor [Oscillospiraceae bacterium]|nr:Nif11-like leader peptide family natural product precursor [Oscillospiraceae bacterium]
MDKKDMEQFFKFLSENPEHQSKIKSFGSDIDALADYAQKLGYDFSTAELRELLKDMLQKRLAKFDVNLSPGAQAFYALIKLAETDGKVAERLTELGTGRTEDLVAYGKENGFIFSEQDIQDFGKDILEPYDELSEEELELAAGGTTVLVAFGVSAAIVLGIAAMGGAFIAFGVVGKF